MKTKAQSKATTTRVCGSEREVKVTGCVRCAKNHCCLTFKKFRHGSVEGYDYWAICPNTQEPILMRIMTEQEITWSVVVPPTRAKRKKAK